MNMFQALVNRWASRSIKPWGPGEEPTWRSFINRRLLTEEQVSRLESSNLKPYIVHVAPPTDSSEDLLSYYQTFLPKTAAGEDFRMLFAYDFVFKGFAAYLSTEEVKAMEKIPGFWFAKEPRPMKISTVPGLDSSQNLGFQNDKGVIVTVEGWKSIMKERSQSKTREANLGEETNCSN